MDLSFFNPNGVGVDNGNYFGLPFTPEEAGLVIISAPWDVTSSYGAGSSYAPDAIIEASTQLDLYDPVSPDEWRKGIATDEIDYSIQENSQRLRSDAERVIEHLEDGGDASGDYFVRKIRRINEGSAEMNESVRAQAGKWLSKGKIVALVGGDHSTSYGVIHAVSERFDGVGILHFDAHCDLRESYEGFDYSHASIMFNVLRDMAIGLIPFWVGNILDFFNRAYLQNCRLIVGFVEDDREIIREVNRKAFWMGVGIVVCCILIYWLISIAIAATAWTFNFISSLFS